VGIIDVVGTGTVCLSGSLLVPLRSVEYIFGPRGCHMSVPRMLQLCTTIWAHIMNGGYGKYIEGGTRLART
jgi:hypothetical protein